MKLIYLNPFQNFHGELYNGNGLLAYTLCVSTYKLTKMEAKVKKVYYYWPSMPIVRQPKTWDNILHTIKYDCLMFFKQQK